MSQVSIENSWQFSYRGGFFLVLSAIVFCLTLTISYSAGILPWEVLCLLLFLPPLLLLFLIRQEALLLAIVVAYFGAGYFFSDLLTQSLIRVILLSFLGLMLILRSGAKQAISRITTPLDRIVFLWLGIILVSFFYGFYVKGNEASYLIGDLYKFIEIISVFWLTTFLVKTRKQIRFLVWGFLFAVLIFGAVDSMLFFARASLIGGALAARIRAGAQFSSIFALLLIITLMLHEKRMGKRIVLAFLGFVFFFSFFISFLRTGYVALPIALIVILVLYFRKHKARVLKGTMSFIFLFVFILAFLAFFGIIITNINPDIDIIEAMFTRLASFGGSATADNPMGVRILEARSIINNVLVKNPLLGNGLGGQYYSAVETPEGLEWKLTHYIHINYFDFLARSGVLGLLVFLLIAFKYLKDVTIFYLKAKDSFFQGVLLGFIGIFVAAAVIALSTSIFYSPLLFLIMAMSYCVTYCEKITSRTL